MFKIWRKKVTVFSCKNFWYLNIVLVICKLFKYHNLPGFWTLSLIVVDLPRATEFIAICEFERGLFIGLREARL